MLFELETTNKFIIINLLPNILFLLHIFYIIFAPAFIIRKVVSRSGLLLELNIFDISDLLEIVLLFSNEVNN